MPMMPTLRCADPATARRYPLPVPGPGTWQAGDGGWRLALTLPDLPPGTILVPSLALAPPAAAAGHASAALPRHRWVLASGDGRWPLQPVPAVAGEPAPPVDGAVTSRIDCFHVHRRLASPVLQADVTAPVPPEHYLACVSARALTVAEPSRPDRAVALPAVPPPQSQLAAPQAIAGRICSPTCVSMVLTLWRRPHDWLALAEECHDPASGMYGVWPVALAAAARRGSIGAVEVFDGWAEPLAVLERGVPLVTSIRFAAGELPGAPLPETGGHLVVVYGAGPETVQVCDPAATAGEVLRRYPAEAFSRAWLRHRGAAYILPP